MKDGIPTDASGKLQILDTPQNATANDRTAVF